MGRDEVSALLAQQDPSAFSSIQGVLLLDGKDPAYLHVQETSADGTWQPVIPTP